MARHAHEMYCTNCTCYLYPMLSDKMNGNYIIKCGRCGHDHLRHIKNGVVTNDRHYEKRGACHVIHVPKSACSDKPKPKGSVQSIRAMETAGLAT